MFPDDLAVFQYYKGIGFGLLIGLSLGWLMWRMPSWARSRHVRNLRRQVLDMHRIEAAFRGTRVPNPRELRVLRVPLRDRIMEMVQVWVFEWKHATAPRTPEQMAYEARQRELAGAT